MRCEEVNPFVDAYVDGEFSGDERLDLELHLDRCPSCAGAVQQRQAFQRLVKKSLVAPTAPPHLKTAIKKGLRSAGPDSIALSMRSVATLAAAVVLVFVVPGILHKSSVHETDIVEAAPLPLIEASVDWHRQSLPSDVTGPNTQHVTEWFSDKVDFPVRLPEFEDSSGCNVVGGRLTSMNNNTAAHIVYDVEGTKVSVLLFEDPGDLQVPRRKSPQVGADYYVTRSAGYNVALFNDNGVTYTITTDLPEQTFSNLVSTASFRE